MIKLTYQATEKTAREALKRMGVGAPSNDMIADCIANTRFKIQVPESNVESHREMMANNGYRVID